MSEITATPPETARVESVRAQIAALTRGNSWSHSTRIPIASIDGEELVPTLQSMRDRINPAVARAKRDTGAEFTVETGEFLSRDKTAIILTVAVTRHGQA